MLSLVSGTAVAEARYATRRRINNSKNVTFDIPGSLADGLRHM